MIRSSFILILLFLSGTIHPRSGTDQLLVTWSDTTLSDSVRAFAFKDHINKDYLYSDPDSAIILAKQLEEFGQNRNYAMAESMGAHIQGLSWHVRGDYPKALKCYARSINIGEDTGDKKGVSSALNNIGVIYFNQGNYTKALEYHRRSLKLKKELGDQKGIANSLNSIGNIYSYQADYPNALEYFEKSLEIAEELGDELLIAGFLNNFGFIYERRGDAEKALEYFTESLEMNERIGSEKGIALSLGNIGNAQVLLGEYDQALDAFSESLTISEELGDQKSIANIYNNIGTIYQIKNDEANAMVYCTKGFELARTLGLLKHMKDGCECLYELYKASGNGSRALEYHEILKGIDDSLNTEETAKSLQRMEFAKQMLADSIAAAEKEHLVQEAHERKIDAEQRSRNISRAIGAFFILLAGGLYNRVRYISKSKTKLQAEKDRSEELLLNILPAEIAEELKEKGEAAARDFEDVSILFTDFKGFTQASEKLSATDLVAEINTCFKAFDGIVGKYNIEKIKTIGDAYMCAGGLPVPDENAAKNTVLAGLEMQAFMKARKTERDAQDLPAFEMRVGIHTGPVVAGIVGVKKFQYDIWGDTVNTASRMESSGEVGQVNISEATYEMVKKDPEFSFTFRGKIEAKGKGALEMFFASKLG